MENDKATLSGIVEAASRRAGALVGTAMVAGKKFELCVRNMVTGVEGPPGQAAKKPIPARAKKKRKKTAKKRPVSKKAKVKKKMKKRKKSSSP